MLKLITLLTTLFIYHTTSSFLQCSPSDSLESLDDLQEREYAEKQGVICEEWPFYAGGFATYSSSSSSSSSSEDEEKSSEPSLLPDTITSESILYGFDDSVETTQCLQSRSNYCNKWVSTKKEYEGHKGCNDDKDDANILTEYQLCLCADNNYNHPENIDHEIIVSTSMPDTGNYCSIWACLETAQYPTDYDTYSLIMDNTFVQTSSSSSSDESGEDEDKDDILHGDYYRFTQNGNVLALDESMEMKNCWCKSASLNGEYCLNWYCESLQHDEHGCHKQAFGVDDYGWFGCYINAQDIDTNTCDQWYGFLIDDEEREEYRCECIDEDCISSICGARQIPLRKNYMWYNFWLALIVWGCLCGCCGTKCVFKNRCNDKCFKCFRCRKCRMVLFFLLFGFIAMIHGGIPAFMFFVIIASCSLCCAKKCENCKCCSKQCSMKTKWENMKKKCEMECNATVQNTNTIVTTDKDGENSKEDSQSDSKKQKLVSKSGHVRVNSIDLDEIDGDEETEQVKV